MVYVRAPRPQKIYYIAFRDYRENDTSYPRAPGNTGYDSVARAQSKAKRADGRIAMSKWLQPKSEPGEAPQDVCLDRVLDGSASSMSCY